MAQHYFSFERDRGGDWPAAIKRAEADAGWFVDKAYIQSIATGAVLSISSTVDNAWKYIRFPVYAKNIEMLLVVRRARAEQTMYNNTGVGLFFRGREQSWPQSLAYYASVGAVGGSGTHRYAYLYRFDVNGNQSGLQSAQALPVDDNVWSRITKFVCIRVRAQGDVIRCRFWLEGSPEPATWNFEATRPANESPGTSCGILVFGYSSLAEIKYLSMGTDGDVAPNAPPAQLPIAGNATVVTGGPVARVLVVKAESNETHVALTPAENGDWNTEVPPGDYYFAYLNPGCQPIIHGPYTIAAE